MIGIGHLIYKINFKCPVYDVRCKREDLRFKIYEDPGLKI